MARIYTARVHNTDLPSMARYIQPEYTILTYLPWPEYIQPEYTILTYLPWPEYIQPEYTILTYLPWPEYIQPEYTILTFATSRYKPLKSTCDVNLLSKLSIIFKEWRVIVLFVL